MLFRALIVLWILFSILYALRLILHALRAPKRRPKPAEDSSVLIARAILEVSERASSEEIRAAFRAKAAEAHPDSGGDAAKMRDLTIARDLLLSKADRTARRD